jgi:mannose-1-phosphate guanylyltransferase/mannose-6-phosphate isomerase
MSRIFVIVMAGGVGKRLWPESTEAKPKQYHALYGEAPLIVQTLDRFKGVAKKEDCFILTTRAQRDMAIQITKLPQQQVLCEPEARNTAPCIFFALAKLRNEHGCTDSDMIVIVPSDHIILQTQGFQETIHSAIKLTSDKKFLATIGIVPTFPHTGFGYIERGAEIEGSEKGFSVQCFVEKPPLEKAKNYLASGKFYWNAGMFVGSFFAWMNEFSTHAPEFTKRLDGLTKHLANDELLHPLYNELPKTSIDYAIMEKSKNIIVIPSRFDWNDLGSWSALAELSSPQDGKQYQGNRVLKSRAFYADKSNGNVVYAPGKVVALVDIKDYLIVDNDKSLMIMPLSDDQKVKDIVDWIGNQKELSDLI